MKQVHLIVLSAFLVSGCKDDKAQEKALISEIISIHDKVMAADEHLIKNKVKFDSLLKQNHLPLNNTAQLINNKLTVTETSMENWMHNFNPEQTGKPHLEIITYLGNQKREITAINHEMNAVIAQSDKYLSKAKSK